MEDDAPRSDRDPVEPDPVERLRALEEEMLRLKEQLSPRDDAPEAEAEPEPEVVEPEPLPDPEKVAEAEDLVRRAMLAKRRSQKDEAAALFKQAEAVAPNAPAVLEAVGDDLVERGQIKAAIETYARAIKYSPSNVGLERKHANLVLRLTGAATIEQQLRGGLSEAAPDSVASGKVAVFLSVFVPGLGQMVTNRLNLGITMLALWVVAWIPALTIRDSKGVRAISNLPDLISGRGADVSALVMVGLGVALITHFASVAEAATKVPKKSSGPKPMIERPRPPVDLPFE